MGYVDVPWNIKCEADEVLIPHALAVSPDCQGKGIGKRVVKEI
ncbi:MAG: GNAT family N-acetyltransferase [Blautia sp.]|nr:GNAT family N-acetyltransferase [Blautia sp.]MCI6303605.1 GNAT family N-acetyltransferase [Blautia sp.]MCI7450818.1 GNAT family N-acetyltransferase [Blautia sp.]MDD6412911.1 GNAT family N-acetyltransferase [Blautia sp.]MDY4116212.1 GNAT family N-acetyltransferase [Blautia sp.]